MRNFLMLFVVFFLSFSFSVVAENSELSESSLDNTAHSLASDKHVGIFPHHRVVVYYGNFNSPKMGILGEYPADEIWKRLKAEAEGWEKRDPSRPVVTGLQYIATVASNHPNGDGLYRNRMSNEQIQKALTMVRMTQGAILILDVQPGLSDLQSEIARLDPFLMQPDVHLAIDPEFVMKKGAIPGSRIGSLSYQEINQAISHLSALVSKYQLPPKILVIHRFTKKMVTGFDKLTFDPDVQLVLNMDGWGAPETKRSTYKTVISSEKSLLYPGIKIFYKNDVKYAPHKLLTKEEVLGLQPQPIYIQYQ